jgi:hypothetical protein
MGWGVEPPIECGAPSRRMAGVPISDVGFQARESGGALYHSHGRKPLFSSSAAVQKSNAAER